MTIDANLVEGLKIGFGAGFVLGFGAGVFFLWWLLREVGEPEIGK